MRNLVVGLPCYNEEDNIGKLMTSWLSLAEQLSSRNFYLQLIPLDDKSKDNTKQVLKEYAAAHSNIKPIFHSENKNLGGGLNSLIDYFLREYKQGDVLVIMDGDNTQLPKYIFSMLDKMEEGKDVVIASRYREGADVLGLHPLRKFLSLGARFYYQIVLHIKGVRDYTCGYRIYGYDILQKAKKTYGCKLVENKSFACMMEVLYKLYKVGAEIGEVGFVLRYDNKEGQSKMNFKQTIKDSFISALKIRKELKNDDKR